MTLLELAPARTNFWPQRLAAMGLVSSLLLCCQACTQHHVDARHDRPLEFEAQESVESSNHVIGDDARFRASLAEELVLPFELQVEGPALFALQSDPRSMRVYLAGTATLSRLCTMRSEVH